MDEELVEKVARVLFPEPGDPSTPTERETWETFSFPEAKHKARVAIKAMIDAGWKGPEKPRLLDDVS